MAEEKELERTYNIPLRRNWLKVPMYKRSKKAIAAIREFIARHMKVEDDKIKLGRFLNEQVWTNGIRNPPHHVKVIASKDKDGIVKVEIVGAPSEKKEEKSKKEKKKSESKQESEEREESKEKSETSEPKKRSAGRKKKSEGEDAPASEEKPEN
ncbi:MAG: 50S ribosomal protein L31e [Candidatus Woesearchaeota archaeon]